MYDLCMIYIYFLYIWQSPPCDTVESTKMYLTRLDFETTCTLSPGLKLPLDWTLLSTGLRSSVLVHGAVLWAKLGQSFFQLRENAILWVSQTEGPQKKNYTNPVRSAKTATILKKLSSSPIRFFRQREHGKLDGRRISIAEGFRHHGIDGVLLRAQHTGLNHRFGRHRRIFGRQILGNPEPPRAPPQELHELYHSKWWVNSQPSANFSKGSEFSVRIDFCTDEPRDVESFPESFPGSRIWRETCHAQGPQQDMAPFQNFLVGGERSERGRWSSILYTEIYPVIDFIEVFWCQSSCARLDHKPLCPEQV